MLTLPVEQRLSLDVSFLKFKMAVRASHFETAQHALLEDRRLANHDRYALQRQLAPMPRQLQATTSKLEAVELELGGISKVDRYLYMSTDRCAYACRRRRRRRPYTCVCVR